MPSCPRPYRPPSPRETRGSTIHEIEIEIQIEIEIEIEIEHGVAHYEVEYFVANAKYELEIAPDGKHLSR